VFDEALSMGKTKLAASLGRIEVIFILAPGCFNIIFSYIFLLEYGLDLLLHVFGQSMLRPFGG